MRGLKDVNMLDTITNHKDRPKVLVLKMKKNTIDNPVDNTSSGTLVQLSIHCSVIE